MRSSGRRFAPPEDDEQEEPIPSAWSDGRA
jgi:hypothetical protein